MKSIRRSNYAAGRYTGPAGFLGPTTRPSRPDLDDIAAMLAPIVRLARGPDWRVDIDWTTDCLIARNDSGEWTTLARRIEIDDNRWGEILARVPRKSAQEEWLHKQYPEFIATDMGGVLYGGGSLNPVGCSDPNCRVCQVWRDADASQSQAEQEGVRDWRSEGQRIIAAQMAEQRAAAEDAARARWQRAATAGVEVMAADSGALAAGTGSGGGSLVGTGREVVNYDATPTTITAAHLDAAWEEVRRYKEVAAARLVDSRPIHDWGKSDPGAPSGFVADPVPTPASPLPIAPVATFPARAMRARSPNDFRVGFVE